jgi:hypothetical protein
MATPKLTFATYWIRGYAKIAKQNGWKLDDLDTCDDVANGFGRVMKLVGHTWEIDLKEEEVKPADWIDLDPVVPKPWFKSSQYTYQGDDTKAKSGVDTVDIALFSGHTGLTSESKDFGGIELPLLFNQPPGAVGNFQMRLGNGKGLKSRLQRMGPAPAGSTPPPPGTGKLKWLILDACHTLETVNDPKGTNPSNLWRNTFDGLHAVFGFTGLSTDHWWTSGRGQSFAINATLFDHGLADAWIDAAAFWLLDDIPGAAAAGVDKDDAKARLNEKLSSPLPSIPHEKVKYVAWRFRYSFGDADRDSTHHPKEHPPYIFARQRGGAP